MRVYKRYDGELILKTDHWKIGLHQDWYPFGGIEFLTVHFWTFDAAERGVRINILNFRIIVEYC